MKRIFQLALFITCLMPMALWAQDEDPRLTVNAKKQVMVGERFQVVFEANAEGKSFTAPSFEGFNVVGGPFTSSSSSISMTSSGVTRTVRNSYTYALQAYQEGTFRIGSASLTVKGEKITSEPFEIKVVPDDGSTAVAVGEAIRVATLDKANRDRIPATLKLAVRISSSKSSLPRNRFMSESRWC